MSVVVKWFREGLAELPSWQHPFVLGGLAIVVLGPLTILAAVILP